MAEASISFKYALAKIEVKKFCIESVNDNNFSIEKLPVNLEMGFKIDPDNGKIYILMAAKVHAPNKVSAIAELIVEFSFSVQGLDSLEKKNDQLKIPQPFLFNLVNISYGTLRGIFHERVSNTFLSQFILPIIYPKDLLEKGKK